MLQTENLNRVHFKLPLHPAQREVVEHPARFKVLATGRRWGKTLLAAALAVTRASTGERGWYVIPDYKQGSAKRAWRKIRGLSVKVPGVRILEAERRIEFPGGGWLELKSAHDQDALRGEGLDFVIVDEAAYMRETTWPAELRPTLADKLGDALLISTFQGENWFYDLYQL